MKFLTCGSVDDGKSTLIGRMLYDARLAFSDQLREIEKDGKADYSLLLDGLLAEREQGITIDVAYRYFTTEKRSFVVADSPGHEQYTRNMAVGASFAELAVLLCDVRNGLKEQTYRHMRICRMMGIDCFILAVNKMDLANYRDTEFLSIEAEFKKFAENLEAGNITVIPVSAKEGENVTFRSERMPWYNGKTLLQTLEEADVTPRTGKGFVLPVQLVCRPNTDFRGFQGTVERGYAKIGDEVTVLPSGERAKINELFVGDEESRSVSAEQAVTVCLDRDVDISRGDVILREAELAVGNIFAASILWTDSAPLIPNREYFIKLGTQIAAATVTHIKHRLDVKTGDHIAAKTLERNEIGNCEMLANRRIVFDTFEKSKVLGGFILIDRVTNMTSACGMIRHPMRRADNLFYREADVTNEMRAAQKSQIPVTLWFTGLSGSGKSYVANALERRLYALGRHSVLLDGDNLRRGLNGDLGFTEIDRVENIRRVAEVAKLMNDAGLICLVAFISPYDRDREHARSIIGGNKFILVHISTPIDICEQRDVKGLYEKARSGKITNFTGVNAPYEIPPFPNVTIDTSVQNIEESVEILLQTINDITKNKKGELL